jgi:hypothetical protein
MYMAHVDYVTADWSSMIPRNVVADPLDYSAVLRGVQKRMLWIIIPATTSDFTANKLCPSIRLLFALNVQYKELSLFCNLNTLTEEQELWDEPVAYFPLIRHGPHIKPHVQKFFYFCVCIRCSVTVIPSRCLAMIGGYPYGHKK